MPLTPEQEKTGRENFSSAVGVTRRNFLTGLTAGAAGIGATYFGYKELKGEPVRTAFIGTGDEGNILLTQHPPKYMDIVAIADLRPTNRDRAFKGDGNEHRAGLIQKLGAERAGKIKIFNDHKALLQAKDELQLEAVVIATPLVSHHDIAIAAMDAGLHVLTEKLMAKTVTECKDMIRKARATNRLLAVGHQRHYSVLYDNANWLVQSGTVGDIKYIRAQWHRNNSFPGSDQWNPKIDAADQKELEGRFQEFGYESVEQLVKWRLFNSSGGGLMAELGSHQMDAASIFLGHVHPLAVNGYGGKNFYGVKGLGTEDKQTDPRDIDDHIYVTFEFPGKHFEEDNHDVCIVTYSSINTNKFEPYGELVYGSRGTLFMKTEKEGLLWKEEGRGSEGGGPDQRLWVVSGASGGPVLNAYETSSGAAKSASNDGGWGENISRGYTEEMEHFCWAIREYKDQYYRDGQEISREEGGLRCNGVVAMADAIMAHTANLAMKHRKRIEFKPEWFDPGSDAAPETDPAVVG
ncbi:MAG: Gfo/Idh/MocA family oxidoreductase [Planctomycetaceae bacterium]